MQKTVASCLLLIVSVNGILGNIKKSPRPHMVIIIGDDIGWNDFGFHGSNQIPTPNIDAMGYNGVVLNRFYTQAICTPSRAALLTGNYPIRSGLQGIPLSAGEDGYVPEEMSTLPEKLRDLGYRTHLVGKWHLGAARRRNTPTGRGFDTHFGYWNGFVGYFDYFAYQEMNAYNMTQWSGLDLHNVFTPQWDLQGRYATELFTEKALEIIDNHDTREPLFLTLAHLAAHTGANGTELGVINITATNEKYKYIKEPMRRRLADIVNGLDTSIGQVVKKLAEKDMLENSIVLFFSDNGAQTSGTYENFGSNWPLKGLKFTLYEGGVRGSAVLLSPLLTKKGYINNHLIHITDLMPTLYYLAGGKVPDLGKIDGINQWHTISENLPTLRNEALLNVDKVNGFSGLLGCFGRYKLLNGTFLNGIYDLSTGDSGRSDATPSYDYDAVIDSEVNQAMQRLKNVSPLSKAILDKFRKKLDVSLCKNKTRTTDIICKELCLFDIFEDPCETENIIDQRPLIAANLKTRLWQFVKETVSERKRGVDLKSNPRFYNNTWCTWLDDSVCYKTPLNVSL